MAYRFVLALPIALMACVEPGIPPDPVDACGASELQWLVGQRGTVLVGMRFDTDVRVIQPGTVVTMDFSATRLNIYLNRADVIERVACG